VRELENVIERAVILSAGAELEVAADLLPVFTAAAEQPITPEPPLPASPAPVPDGTGTLDQVQRDHIVAALNRSNWRIDGPTGAAQALQLNPSTLRSRMKKLGIRRL
jgi:transcriptional regulator with GAF, ATPase, and Fis domain